ncbi:DUF4199 domain-containing protein [Chitinophaga rhizophila]|uniref:DUF4199 domain-containing protein n=1 Tax=Chitinophaga rhizophila TaxID=2866212 RepID=A0ABS7GMA4_9BACT|nr:DUF4199 domain-containing protein [Chitinophaga rhizophila]MBW8687733.1 DUF4199 domain-containing protein [Chitinophaga rhizophila]
MSNATYPNPGLKWGVIAAVVVIATGIALYYTDQPTFFSLKFSFIQLFICAIIGLLAGLEKRRHLGGFIGFKDAIQPIFTTFVIGTLAGTLLTYIVCNYIDPELPARMKAMDLKMLEEMQQSHNTQGITDADLNDALTKLKQQDYSLTFVASMLSYFTGLFLDFVVAAILAVIIRKKRIA